jgi:hypothetical protein
MNEKSVTEHLKDGTFRKDRHGKKLKNYRSFALLARLPKYSGELLNETGQKFYTKLGRQLIREEILTALDLPVIEQAAHFYQCISNILNMCGGDFDSYIFENNLCSEIAAFLTENCCAVSTA